MKQNYQLVIVLNGRTEEKDRETVFKKIKEKLDGMGAEFKDNHLGIKDFVYQIDKNDKGDFWSFDVKSDKTIKMNDFNVFLNREPKVIRYLMLKK